MAVGATTRLRRKSPLTLRLKHGGVLRATSMASNPAVLLIGLDSADPSMLGKWSGEGYLPNLRKLMQTGQVTNMGSVAPEFPDEVWPSIYTSQNAAQTGKYYYIQIKPGTLEFQMLDDKPLGTQFWVTPTGSGSLS